MCDGIYIVCEKCCCDSSSSNIGLWIVLVVGALIAIGMFFCFIYFHTKSKREYKMDADMKKTLEKRDELPMDERPFSWKK